MDNKKFQTLHRYANIDAYTTLEIKWRYEHADPVEKIALLEEVKEGGNFPDFLAEIIVLGDDDFAKVWLAKNADYGMDKEISIKLLKDKDPYIKVRALENNYFGNIMGPSVESFNKSSQVERLAAIRSGHVSGSLTDELFNYKDKNIKISTDERAEIITAYISNKGEIEDSRKGWLDHVDGLDAAFTGMKFSKMWELISEWPEKYNGLKHLVYQYIGNGNESKVKIYKKSPIYLKASILQGCTGNAIHDDDVIKMGLIEKDEREGDAGYCRKIAYLKVKAYQLPKEDLEKVLASEDREAIAGIGWNKSFSFQIRGRALSRLRELGDDLEAHHLEKSLDKEPDPVNIEFGDFSDLTQEEKIDTLLGKIASIELNMVQNIKKLSWLTTIVIVGLIIIWVSLR